MGFTVVGLGLLDISVWFFLLRFVFKLEASAITSAMLTFGMGASSMALFARVGGGIFTKAADVGADLVGKVEAGIPEDDPRNPAVIADNVGDNVGDVAGMGADLYESYVGSIISASALGVAAFSDQAFKAMAIPMVMAAIGIICSIIGTFFVRTDEQADQRTLLKALSRGTNLSAILIAIIACPLVILLLGKEHLGLYLAILAGLIAGVLIGKATEYYTSDTFKPTQDLSSKSQTGAATIIIGGLGLGMLSTAVPIIIVAICILVAYLCSGGATSTGMGLYGIALAAVGMLSTLGITLAAEDILGNVAGGLVILFSHPFSLGDEIEVGGTTGTVREISLTHTKIETPDGQIVLQPNREMSSSKIINFTVLGRRRIVYKVTASYDAPTDEVKQACMDAVLAFPAVLKEPTPTVYLSNYGASSIEYTIRCWTAADAYWDTYFKMYERLRNTFAKHNVEMSYDHLNIHVVPEKQNEN